MDQITSNFDPQGVADAKDIGLGLLEIAVVMLVARAILRSMTESNTPLLRRIGREGLDLSPLFMIVIVGLAWILVAGEMAMYIFLFLMLIKVGMLSEDKKRATGR